MRNGGDPRQPHGVNEVRLRRGEIVREGLHTTLADLRMLGPKVWRKICPESSIFILTWSSGASLVFAAVLVWLRYRRVVIDAQVVDWNAAQPDGRE
jgi:hypothetical protein